MVLEGLCVLSGALITGTLKSRAQTLFVARTSCCQRNAIQISQLTFRRSMNSVQGKNSEAVNIASSVPPNSCPCWLQLHLRQLGVCEPIPFFIRGPLSASSPVLNKKIQCR